MCMLETHRLINAADQYSIAQPNRTCIVLVVQRPGHLPAQFSSSNPMLAGCVHKSSTPFLQQLVQLLKVTRPLRVKLQPLVCHRVCKAQGFGMQSRPPKALNRCPGSCQQAAALADDCACCCCMAWPVQVIP